MKKMLYTFILLLFIVSAANAQTLHTVAGNADSIGSNDGAASSATFNYPTAVAVDTNGNIWVADQHNSTIRMISPAGEVHTRAGAPGHHSHTDASGITSRFNFPVGVAIGPNNEIYVADQGNKVIRKISPLVSLGSAQQITTLAGSPNESGSDDGTGSAARFNYITGIATAPNGDIYITERDLHTVRKITPSGVVTTYAGETGTSGDADGSLTAARFNRPNGLTVAANGDIYVTESAGRRIRKISNGQVTTIAGGNTNYSVDGHINDSDPAKRPGFFNPAGILAAPNGDVYLSEARCRIRKISNDTVSTFAGIYEDCGYLDGPAASGKLHSPHGIAWDKTGENIIIADYGNHIIRRVSLADDEDTTISGVAKKELLQVKIYPNPVTDVLNIQMPEDATGSFNLQVYDMNGRKVEDHIISNFTRTLSLQNLKQGLYLIRIEQQGETVFYKRIQKL